MPLSEFEQHRAERTLREYCAGRSNPDLKGQLEIVYRIEGNYAYISERRPDFRDPSVMRDSDVAKFRFIVKDRKWKLFWMGRNLRWRTYDFCEPSTDLAELLPTVDEDPIFYG